MADTLQLDSNLSHGVINFISSQLRGRFAFLNVLKQSKHRQFQDEDLQKLEKELLSVQRWLKELWSGMPLFSTAWTQPQTFEAQKAFDLIKNIKSNLIGMHDGLLQVYKHDDAAQNDEDLKLMLGSYAFWAYSRDNLIKGLIQYGQHFKRDDIVSFNQSLVGHCEAEVKNAGMLLKQISQNRPLTDDFHSNVGQAVMMLPPRLKAFMHECCLLLAIYAPVFRYEHADFTSEEAADWQNEGFHADQAGYWRAYMFAPGEARDWAHFGIIDPAYAFIWRLNAFEPQDSSPWVNAGIAPLLARQWLNAGYTFETARKRIEMGMPLPPTPESDN